MLQLAPKLIPVCTRSACGGILAQGIYDEFKSSGGRTSYTLFQQSISEIREDYTYDEYSKALNELKAGSNSEYEKDVKNIHTAVDAKFGAFKGSVKSDVNLENERQSINTFENENSFNDFMKEVRNYKQGLESTTTSETQATDVSETYRRVINPSVVSAWEQCIKNVNADVKVWNNGVGCWECCDMACCYSNGAVTGEVSDCSPSFDAPAQVEYYQRDQDARLTFEPLRERNFDNKIIAIVYPADRQVTCIVSVSDMDRAFEWTKDTNATVLPRDEVTTINCMLDSSVEEDTFVNVNTNFGTYLLTLLGEAPPNATTRLENQLTTLENDQNDLENELNDLRNEVLSEVQVLRDEVLSEVQALREEVANLTSLLEASRMEFDEMYAWATRQSDRASQLRTDFDMLKNDFGMLKNTLMKAVMVKLWTWNRGPKDGAICSIDQGRDVGWGEKKDVLGECGLGVYTEFGLVMNFNGEWGK